MPFGLCKKDEYERVQAANNELRAKMEKLRLENTMLKERIRALTSLPPKISSIYIALQEKGSASIEELATNPQLKGRKKQDIQATLDKFCEMGLVEKIGDKYGIKTPEHVEVF